MKELSLEQKAKAYDEAKYIMEEYLKSGNAGVIAENTIKKAFPELQESKDERIRQLLIRFVAYDMSDNYSDDFTPADCIAWLEKQGENNMGISEAAKKELEDNLNKALEKETPESWNKFLDEQGEQKLYVNDNAKEMFIKALERVEEQNNKGYKLTDCDKNSWWEDFKAYTTSKQILANSAKTCKVEPKFKVGDWVIDKQDIVHQIANVIENVTNHTYSYDIVGGGYFNDNTEGVRLWTIQDAKEGDILTSIGFHSNCTFIFNGLDNWKFDEPNGDRAVATGYCCLTVSADKMEFGIQGPDCIEVNTVKPATKIQRDLLFEKMKEAGYEWNAEKKELKKISQRMVSAEAKEAMYDKPAWSEEDERIYKVVLELIDSYSKGTIGGCIISPNTDRYIKWLKSLKCRVKPKPKQEWNDEDEEIRKSIIDIIERRRMSSIGSESAMCEKQINFLKSLRPQNTWKPSYVQMEVLLSEVTACTKGCPKQIVLESIYNDLKKLREE